MLRLRGGEGRLLFGCRLLLVLLAPRVIGHAVDDLAGFGIAERDALFVGRGAVPFRQAVAAEAGEVHQIDVLDVGAFAQMRDQRAERRRFELGTGLVVHLHLLMLPPSLAPYVASPDAILNASRIGDRKDKITQRIFPRIGTTMRRFVFGLFAAIGIVTVLAVVGGGVALWRLALSEPALPKTIVLKAELGRGLAAGAGRSPLSELVFGGKATLRDFLDALERAGEDARVKGLYVRL